jgi:hypothetical protein
MQLRKLQRKFIKSLYQEKGRLENQLDQVNRVIKALALDRSSGHGGRPKRRRMAAAARAKISRAAKKRWAKVRAQAKKVAG